MNNTEYFLHCFTISDKKLSKDIKENIDDYDNILSLIVPFIIKKEFNIGLVGPPKAGKTSLIYKLQDIKLPKKYIGSVDIFKCMIEDTNFVINIIEIPDNIEVATKDKIILSLDMVILMLEKAQTFTYDNYIVNKIIRNASRKNIPIITFINKCNSGNVYLNNTIDISVKGMAKKTLEKIIIDIVKRKIKNKK